SIKNVELVTKKEEDEFEWIQKEFFDCIIANNVLEHTKNARRIIVEFSRILKVGGVLVLSLPSENNFYKLFESEDDGHILRSEKEIDDLIEFAEQNLQKIYNIDLFPFYKGRVLLKKS
ncbi:MAG: methyltransferase domain-containing protein, partial [Candidatus Micrarchaeaceae archaeon]